MAKGHSHRVCSGIVRVLSTKFLSCMAMNWLQVGMSRSLALNHMRLAHTDSGIVTAPRRKWRVVLPSAQAAAGTCSPCLSPGPELLNAELIQNFFL